MNICSVIVHTRPDAAAAVQKALEQFEGVEVHGGQNEGKLIVTVESHDDKGAAETMTKFNDVKGVISTALIYHHNEDEESTQSTGG